MSSIQWFILVGGLLLIMGLTSSILRRAPITSAIIYLAVGVLVGPTTLNLFHFNPLRESALLEVLTEIAVLISLFSAGVKMPVPFSFSRWRTPILLATISMALTVAMVTAFAYYILGLPLGAGVLLGAIVAPTDPVLATDVQMRHPGDHDKLRFTLTCEAGMNDGSAFPFVILGMGLLGLRNAGGYGLDWLLVDVLWATFSGIAIGVIAGWALAHLGWKLRSKPHNHKLMDDFIGLGLIGVVYGLSVLVHAWGFLAVFFSAVALRQTEQKLFNAAHSPPKNRDSTVDSLFLTISDSEILPIEEPVTLSPQMVSEGSLIFKEHLERLSEVILVILIGGTLFVSSWSWRAVGFALFLFVIARPVSVFIGLLATGTPWRIRSMAAWFGVRGIGSLYYLMYAIESGLSESLSLELVKITLIVVTLSIILHGITVKPLLNIFWGRSD
ncbi:MAG: cation:proton antiporter [Spirochaetaceae bacterium]|jgi:NhaP-type Na+/H+ or K+/H+ antiporter|nr:cation:proton antiporter [Spirochaetaceae bacterium]